MTQQRKKVIYFFSFAMCLSFYTPVFATFFQAAHKFTSSQITLLFACNSMVICLFEIPTGLLGDKIGERESLIIGSVLTCVSTLLFIVGNTPLIYIGEIIFGIGSTFFSGPFDALLYQYCEATENKANYSKIVSRSYSLQWLALCVSFMGCSLLSRSGNLTLPFYATLAANFFTCIIAFFIPKVEKDRSKKAYTIFRLAVYEIVKNRELRSNFLLNVLFSMILVCGYQLLQPYLADSGMQTSYNGFLYCVAALLASCGSFIFDKLQKVSQHKGTMLFLSILLIAGCFFGLAKASSIFLIFLFVCCYRLIWGITSPMFSYMVNSSIPADEYRDTIFSLISLSSNLFTSLLLFFFGVIGLNSTFTYSMLGLTALLFSMIVLWVRKNKY